jgi:hypothetical protein
VNERRIRPAAENSVTDIVTNEFGLEIAAPQTVDMPAPNLPEPPTEVVILSDSEGPASAPAHAQDTTTSPTYIMSPSLVTPSLSASMEEAA